MSLQIVTVAQGIPSTPETTQIREEFNFLLSNVISSGSFEALKAAVSNGNVKQVALVEYPDEPPPIIIDPIPLAAQRVSKAFVFRQGTGNPAQNVGENVFKVWEGPGGLYEAIQAITQSDLGLTGFDSVTVEIDGRFGRAVVPAGNWNLQNVTFRNTRDRQGMEFADGAIISGVQALGFAGSLNVFFNGTTVSPITIPPFSFVQAERDVLFRNEDAGALPMFVGAGSFGVRGINWTDGARGGFGRGSLAPLIDVADTTFIFSGTGCSHLLDGMVTDSGSGVFVLELVNDMMLGGELYGSTKLQFTGVAVDSADIRQRDRYKVTYIDDTDSPYDATYNELVIANSGTGAVIVNMPPAGPMMGNRVTIKRNGANPVTATPVGGDAVDAGTTPADGVAHEYRSDADVNWLHVGATA